MNSSYHQRELLPLHLSFSFSFPYCLYFFIAVLFIYFAFRMEDRHKMVCGSQKQSMSSTMEGPRIELGLSGLVLSNFIHQDIEGVPEVVL